MNKNIGLIVRKVHGAYCLQLTQPVENPVLSWAEAPYGQDAEVIGAFNGQEMWLESPAPTRRVYFCVTGKNQAPVWAADTAVEIAAIENFRDMGGYYAADGRSVKWGRFFRSGPVAGMDEVEMEIYRHMHIRSIFDYRAQQEAADTPDVYTAETAYHLVPGIKSIGAQGLADMDMAKQLQSVHSAEDADRMFALFRSLYAALPFDNDAYRQMFAALDSEETVPMIQHCSAGKDRTGVGCALLLLALGVDEETVMEDYLLSALFRAHINHRYVDKMRQAGIKGHALALVARMMTVSPDLLGTSFAEIKARYGNNQTFLEKEYGVTAERRAHWRALHTI